MKQYIAILVFLLIISFILIIPTPAYAIKYSMDTDLVNADASFLGEDTQDSSGWSVADAGDVNGDGYDDVLISATGDDDGGTSAGQTYLILGKATGWSMDADLSNADASFIGEDAYDYSGWSVAGAGDFNGDGYDDILIGAKYNDEGGDQAGQTYLILGKATGWYMDTDLSNVDASFIGEAANDRSGFSVAGAGDVNGDGYDDILIGAWRNKEGGIDAGQTYLILGKASGWAMDTNLTNVDASYLGEDINDWSGRSVAGAGDINGDGYDDFLIGVYQDDEGGNDNAGQTYLILGKATGWAMDTDLSNADASFIGEDMNDNSGYSVTGTGDVNGDGYDDILIGAYRNDEGGTNTGQTYLILGNASGWTMDTYLSNADASFIGESVDDHSGGSVAGAGDVNGDGYDDILVGAYKNDEGGNSAGQTYLILGKTTGWTMDTNLTNVDASFIGEEKDVYSGESVSSAGDVNGDGYDDILIGAYWSNEGGSGDGFGQTYLIFPDTNSKPSSIYSVKAYSDDTFSTEISKAIVNDTIYIELQGTDGNSSRSDISLVNVRSTDSSQMGFNLRLYESGLNTGKYRGSFTVKNRTHDNYHWIKASIGETITVSSIQDTSKKATIFVGEFVLYPKVDNLTAQEDESYDVHYSTIDLPNINWVFETNASWLEWNSSSHNISGTPDNSDVGRYWVRINITKGPILSDEHNLTLVVNNTPPNITIENITTTIQNQQYFVDYNSTDDGQGVITWHLVTNASWLQINANNGKLTGTPMNADVGMCWVNVSVDDGNDGWDASNFTLDVINENDPPEILTNDLITVLEDEEYKVTYEAMDIDIGDILTWHMESNTSFLEMDSATGILFGTPTNDDVGVHWVNVTISDMILTSDSHNFTLTVINVNDPPMISSKPIIKATTLDPYEYQLNVTDVDLGDILTFSLDTKPNNMMINSASGLITWAPNLEQIGDNLVIVRVSDGSESDTQEFNIKVFPPENYAPVIFSDPVKSAGVGEQYRYEVLAEDDNQDDVLTYSLVEYPINMLIDSNSGVILWMPSEDQLGKHNITVKVSDGKLFGIQTFEITVTKEPIINHKPEVTAIPKQTILVGEMFSYQVRSSDLDNTDILTYRLENASTGMMINSVGMITWVPNKDQVGDHTITLNVSDGKDHASIEFTVNVRLEDTTSGGFDYTLMASIIIIIIVVIIVLTFAMIKTRRKKAQKDKLPSPDISDREVFQSEIMPPPDASQTTQTTMTTGESTIKVVPPQAASQLSTAPVPEIISNQLPQIPQIQQIPQLPLSTSTEPEPVPISQAELPPETVTPAVEASVMEIEQQPPSTELPQYEYALPEPQPLPQVQETQSSIPLTIKPIQPTQQKPQVQIIQPSQSEQPTQTEQTPTEESQSIQQNLCSTCNQPLTFYSQNNKYYCYYCQKYE